MNNECKIVEDILPTYIENMTSKETTEFVNKHLSECNNCKKILKDMKENIEKENLEDIETITKIKKYKKKITRIKVIISLIICAFLIAIIGNFGNRYYVLYNALEKNTNYDLGNNYVYIEYEESIERYPDPLITYHQDKNLKKVKGEKVLEWADAENYYYIDEENKTYKISNEENLLRDKDLLKINLQEFESFKNVFDENEKIKKLEVLKLAFSKNIKILRQGFRNKEYYLIQTPVGKEQIYLDKDTFYAERVKLSTQKYFKEYRVIPAIVTYREVQKPDLTGYTEIN